MKKILNVGLKLLGSLIILFGISLLAFNIYLDHQMQQSFQITEKEQEKLKFYQQSEQWFIKNLKQAQITVEGQTLDPKIQYMMQQRGDSDKINRVMEKIFATSTGRKFARNLVDREWTLYSKITPPMQETQDFTVEGRDGHHIPIRIYKPQHVQDENLPILIYAHGGGYLFASIKALDRPVKLIANEAKVMVISMDYRLAPEHPYPAASDDGEDVFLWAKQNAVQFGGDPQRIAFGGDSAGGHIAVNVAQRQIVAGKAPPTMLLLYYPAVGNPMHDRSYQLFGKGYGLDASFFEYLISKVFPNQQIATAQADEYINPQQSQNLQAMPATIIATAGFDILRDSGEKFANQLKKQGVSVTYKNYPTLNHSFLQLSGIVADAEQAATETARVFGKQMQQNYSQSF